MPLLRRRTQIAIKQEAVAGTAETLAAANVIRHTGMPEWDPDVLMTPREALSASLSPRGSVVGTRAARIKFKQYLRGTVLAPVDPTNFPDCTIPLRGCGIQATVSGGSPNEQTSFKPSSTLISDETTGAYCTVGLYVDGKRYMIHGACGNPVFTFTRGVMVLVEYDFLGVYNAPTDTALLVPTYPALVEPPFQSAALSVLGYTSARINSLTLDVGNQVVMRPDPNSATGNFTAQIVGREPKGSFDPEEVLAATKNYYSEWIAGTAGSITTGVFPSTGSNYNQFSLTIPAAAYTKVGLGDRDGLANAPVDYECRANSDAGDDEFELIQT